MAAEKLDTVDINCDMGESFGNWRMGRDEEMLALVTTANVACGFHAGDPITLRNTVGMAKEHGVAVGAHPGFADREGFGRRHIALRADEVAAYLTYQIGALRAFLDAIDLELHHVKPHGALYAYLRDDPEVGRAGAQAIHQFDPHIPLYWPGPARGSIFADSLRELGHPVVNEVYPDLTYDDNGAVIIQRRKLETDVNFAARQVKSFLHDGTVETVNRNKIPIDAESICVHGDGPNAVDVANAIRNAVAECGVTYQAV